MTNHTDTPDTRPSYALVVFDGERGSIRDIGSLAELESDLAEYYTAPNGAVLAEVLSMRHFPAGTSKGDRVHNPF
jgi:hypothetical protein